MSDFSDRLHGSALHSRSGKASHSFMGVISISEENISHYRIEENPILKSELQIIDNGLSHSHSEPFVDSNDAS